MQKPLLTVALRGSVALPDQLLRAAQGQYNKSVLHCTLLERLRTFLTALTGASLEGALRPE